MTEFWTGYRMEAKLSRSDIIHNLSNMVLVKLFTKLVKQHLSLCKINSYINSGQS